MPRTYAKLLTSINDDEEFNALDRDAQWLYSRLLAHKKLSSAGSINVQSKQWAKMAANTTEDDVRTMVDTLVRTAFVLIDEDTDELLLRSFIRHDGGFRNPNMRKGIESAISRIDSKTLTAIAAAELAKALDTGPANEGSNADSNGGSDNVVDTVDDARSNGDSNGLGNLPTSLIPNPYSPTPESLNLNPSSSSTAAVAPRRVGPTTQKRREEEERELRKSDIAKSYADELWNRANQSKIVDPFAFRRKNLATAMADPEMERVVDVMTWPAESIGRAMATGMTHKVTDTTKESGARLVNGAWLAKGVAG